MAEERPVIDGEPIERRKSNVNLSYEQLEELIEKSVSNAIKAIADNEDGHVKNCIFANSIDTEQHKLDHECLKNLQAIFKRIDNIKWASIRTIVNTLVVAGVIAVFALIGINIKS